MADIIIKNADVKEKVVELRQHFLKMQYCLESTEAAALVARIFSSIFTNTQFLKLLMDNLKSLV